MGYLETSLRRLITLFLLLVFCVACGGFKSGPLGKALGLDPAQSTQCVANMALAQSKKHSSTFTQLAKLYKKVRIETLKIATNVNAQNIFGKVLGYQADIDLPIKKGTPLVVAMDGACGYGPTNQDITYHSITLPFDTTVSELEDLASKDECAIGVYNQAEIQKFALPDDPKLSEQKHLSSINYQFTHDFFNDPMNGVKETVVVAVIDSGIDIDHPDLKDHIWTNPREVDDGVDNDCNGYVDDIHGFNFKDGIADPKPITDEVYEDDNGHGTHVAGLIGAISNNGVGVSGVMGKNIKIMALNIFGSEAVISGTQTLDSAISYAAHNGAHVINLSLGSCTPTPSTKLAILNAISRGVTVVVAAGNYSKTLTNEYSSSEDCYGTSSSSTAFVAPAAYASEISGLISVGAVKSLTKNFASYSMSSTTHVEISAPGSDAEDLGLMSTYRDGTYRREQGTSMASPVLSGAIALAYGYAKTKGKILSPQKMEALILNSAPSITQLEEYVKDGKTIDLSTLRDELRDNLNNY